MILLAHTERHSMKSKPSRALASEQPVSFSPYGQRQDGTESFELFSME